MKLNIKTSGVDLDPNIQEYVQKKIGYMEKFGHLLGSDATLHLILAKETEHHRAGDQAYSAEVQLYAMGHSINAKSYGQDIRAAIDGLKDEIQKMLLGAKDKEQTLARRGAAMIKRFLKRG